MIKKSKNRDKAVEYLNRQIELMLDHRSKAPIFYKREYLPEKLAIINDDIKTAKWIIKKLTE